MYGGVRMLSRGNDGSILVGTVNNCILQGGPDIELKPVVQVRNALLTILL